MFKNNAGIWAETLRIKTSDAELNAALGGGLLGTNLAGNSSVSFDGAHFIIGSQLKDVEVAGNTFLDAGRAYISGNINTIVSALNIDEVYLKTKIKVFLKTQSKKIVINLSDSNIPFNFKVYNILGKKILDKEVMFSNKIETDFDYPKGIYLVKVTLKNNYFQTFKILMH